MPDVYNHHPFGCPAYVLDSDLQNGKKIPKWSSRARVAVFLGHSSQHSRTVGLVLSLSTGLVSPQFHVRYDNQFDTIRDGKHQTKSLWQSKCGFDPPSPLPTPTQREHQREPEPLHTTHPTSLALPSSDPPIAPTASDPSPVHAPSLTSTDQESNTSTPPEPPTTTTRSGRVSRLPAHLHDYIVYEHLCYYNPADPLGQHLQSFAASSDPDVMYLHEAMKQPDRKQFVKAMEDEVRAHTAVWAMRRKRDIASQQVYKWKA